MHNGPQVQIRPPRESDAASARDAVNAVAAEKWYLATVDGFSLEQTRTFLKRVVEGALPQVLAVPRKAGRSAAESWRIDIKTSH